MKGPLLLRGVNTVEQHEVDGHDERGRPILNPLVFMKHLTRATGIIPRYDLLTSIIAHDGEFQNVKIDGILKEIKRAGRISFTNLYHQIIYDIFAYYPEKDGERITLPPRSLCLGVYSKDIKPQFAAVPIEEVEYHVRQIVKGRTVVGHDIKNDIEVFSKGVFDGVKIRDTQRHEPYRVYGKGSQRKPKLSVLAEKVLHRNIQGAEHSSVEDAQATMELYLREQDAIEDAQKDWKVEEGSYWGQFGIMNHEYEAFAHEKEDEFDEQETEKFEQVVNTKDLKALPLSNAGSFWKSGSAKVKDAIASRPVLAGSSTMPAQRLAVPASETTSERTARRQSLNTTNSDSSRDASPSSSIGTTTSSMTSLSPSPRRSFAQAVAHTTTATYARKAQNAPPTRQHITSFFTHTQTSDTAILNKRNASTYTTVNKLSLANCSTSNLNIFANTTASNVIQNAPTLAASPMQWSKVHTKIEEAERAKTEQATERSRNVQVFAKHRKPNNAA